MNRFHVIAIIVFGFLLIPSVSFACENNSTKHYPIIETSAKINKDDCCANDNYSKDSNDEGCSGKCCHSKCGCVSHCNSSISINYLKFANNAFNFRSKKQKDFHLETYISSGFFSLWLIPKIS